MDKRIAIALAKLERGGWSLTVGGFARRALRMKGPPMSASDRREAHALMMATGLPHRRVPYAGTAVDVWDYDAP
jgi:hypothetical protein